MLDTQHILALGFLPGMTSAVLRAVVDSGASFREVVTAPPEDLAAIGLRRSSIEGMRDIDRCLIRGREQIERATTLGARIVHFWDAEYPARLREIYSPPTTLYLFGKLVEEDQHAIAIVGTRTVSTYGRLVADHYAESFAAAGVTVVSGLARGVDTHAHVSSLQAGGRTIAVIASGLDQVAPSLAAKLAERIAARGAVVSEYPFGVKAVPAYFPQRNRIISGLSSGTVVVESDLRGGAMITASFALDQNREVFAVPGSISSAKSRGTNNLIRTDRARLTQTPDDVLEALGYRLSTRVTTVTAAREHAELSAFEQRVYEALTEEPAHVDALCERTGMTTSELLVNLLMLEFKGLARQMAGKMFLRAMGHRVEREIVMP